MGEKEKKAKETKDVKKVDKKILEKTEITTRTTVKAIITGYISYGILLGFIAWVIIFAINWAAGYIGTTNETLMAVTLSLLEAIFIFFVLRGICKLSIFDVFRKCKTSSENMNKICSRLNLFIIIFIVIYVLASIGILILNLQNEMTSINITSAEYSEIYSEEFATQLTNEMLEDFYEERTNSIISTVIIELGMVVAAFSIIPFQKKVIEQYNEV